MTLFSGDPDWTAGGAACIGQEDLHAPAEVLPGPESRTAKRERVTAALAICQRCPMLDVCREWTFRVRPYGTVSGGVDLTGQEAQLVPETDDAVIYLNRIRQVCEEAGFVLTDYQQHYLERILSGQPERWQSGGSRPLALRAQCEWLLGHPRVGFRQDRAG